MQTGQNLYDGWVNDSDLIGTHWRYKQVRNLTDWMANEGKDVTNPDLDIADFIGTSFTTAPDKKLYQLPDQQFANLYWFRYDWFNDEKNKADFKAKYGYDLGVPVNWSAYEDIAEFFTGRDVNGKKVSGHMDYGKKDPSLGWRFTDARLSMAGQRRQGPAKRSAGRRMGYQGRRQLPPGRLLRRARRRHQRPGSRLLLQKYLDWLKAYAPPEAQGMTFSGIRSGSGAGQCRPTDLLVHGFHRQHGHAGPAGHERGRHAEVAHGALAAWRLLEGRHEARLSGRRFLDADEIHSR